MQIGSVPLEIYVKRQIYFGLKTSFNKAFVIDLKTKIELIEEDPASEDLIKPLLEGKDIGRWDAGQNNWLILTPIGVEIENYPAILRHLRKWEEGLKDRCDQGEHWWEYRTCSYYDVFDGPQIVWGNLSLSPPFSFVDGPMYAIAPANTIPTNDLFLLGVMNSSSAKFFFSQIAIQRSGGYYEYKPTYVKQLPIPGASSKEKKTIEKLAKKCLDAEGQDCEKWEAEIDKIVTKLYGLEE